MRNTRASASTNRRITSLQLSPAAQGRELVDDAGLDPDQALALRVELRLIGDRAERQGGGDGVERGLGDGDAI
jgi:hypothetical protein